MLIVCFNVDCSVVAFPVLVVVLFESLVQQLSSRGVRLAKKTGSVCKKTEVLGSVLVLQN